MTGTGVNVVRGVLGLLIVLVWAYPVPAQSEPALQFTSPTEFQLHPINRLLPKDLEPSHPEWKAQRGIKWLIFDSLSGHQADAASLTFAVEGQAGENYVYCSAENCGQVRVRVNESTGWLLLGADLDAPRRTRELRETISRFQDFPPQRVEVSVRAGRQKVYQEVRVTAPADVPDCSDYPEMNEDRYRCYYTREIIAPAFRVANSPLVAELPGQLLQDRGEYELVFAEEFEGTYSSFDTYTDRCDRGLAELDQSKWNYGQKSCRSAPQGAPCEYLDGGHLHISKTTQCGSSLNARGNFEPKYGYVEVRYTIGKSASRDQPIYAMLMGDLRRSHAHLLRTHNLPLDSLERLLTLAPWVEIDLIEHDPSARHIVSHQYRNWGTGSAHSQHDSVRPLRTDKARQYCTRSRPCTGTGRLTITEGMEWTPGGYLFLRRVHEGDAALAIIPQAGTAIGLSKGKDTNGRWHLKPAEYLTEAEERAPYFVELDPNDPAFYLEAAGISHIPCLMGFSSARTWPYSHFPATNESELTVDYIRVFQPRNRYADMEPLYQ